VSFNNKRGYFFRINLNKMKLSKLENNEQELKKLMNTLQKQSKEFIKMAIVSNSIHFTTKRILQLNERIKECQNDIFHLSNG
jgi:DNA mismatch repair ATPase MutS